MINKKQCGVLYVRYDKNSPSGKLIEELKKEHRYNLNTMVLEWLFRLQIVEKMDTSSEVGLDQQNQYYYESLKFFSRKIELVKHRIEQITARSVKKQCEMELEKDASQN